MTPRAILIADVSGFSDLCEREGIAAGLARGALVRDVARTLTEGHCGIYVKGWADNIAAVFPTIRQAVGCAESLHAVIPCSSGIGWGEVILDRPIGDLWGIEVNRASRLGEDIAERGQILLTEAAKAAQLQAEGPRR